MWPLPALLFSVRPMTYVSPKAGEMLYAKRTGVSVYAAPSTTSERLLTNSKTNDHNLRDFQAGDQIGTVLLEDPYVSPDGNKFLKVQYWTWERSGDNVFGFKIFGDGNVQMFHEGYINVEDEPEGWIRETWRQLDLNRSEQSDKAAEIETALKSYPGVPSPTSVEKHTDSKGVETWWVTWPNGYTADFDEFVKASAEDKVTLTTRTKTTKTGLTDDTTTDTGKKKTDTGKGDGSGLFTTTNILIGVGVLGMFGLLLTLLLRKQK